MRQNLKGRTGPDGCEFGGRTRRRFLAILPVAMTAACRVLGAQGGTKPRADSGCRRRLGELVYVVDDTPELTDMYRVLLEEAGYEVRTFNDRAEALEAFRADNHLPKLLITDYVGWPISAEDLMAECRQAQPDLKILMVTGMVEEWLSFARTRPDRVLQKPFAIEQFKAEVRALTGMAKGGAAYSVQGF